MTSTFDEARQIAAADPSAHIAWESVYQLEGLEPAPVAERFRVALEVMEQSQTGQTLLRDLLAHNSRPIGFGSFDSGAGVSIDSDGSKVISYGSLRVGYYDDINMRIMVDSKGLMLPQDTEGTLLFPTPQLLAAQIVHESDHAATINERRATGANPSTGAFVVAIDQDEHSAMLRQNAFEHELGLAESSYVSAKDNMQELHLATIRPPQPGDPISMALGTNNPTAELTASTIIGAYGGTGVFSEVRDNAALSRVIAGIAKNGVTPEQIEAVLNRPAVVIDSPSVEIPEGPGPAPDARASAPNVGVIPR